jgi:heptosyltransferase-2
MNSFLIIQTASIGDVILASSLVEKLHRHYPKAEIDFLLKKGSEALFIGHPLIHRLLIWDKSRDKYKNLRELIRLVRKNRYEGVINIQRFAGTGLITALSGANMKIGFSKNPFSLFFTKRLKHAIRRSNTHEIHRNHMLIRQLTDDEPGPVKLYPSARDFAMTSQYKTRKYITIAPASLWYTKQYPQSKWVEFVADIDPSLYIYFLGSGQDKPMCDGIIKEAQHPHCLNLAGKLSLLETAALMRDAGMNFVNDSAPLHLASAMNAPVTAIFCSTVPEFGFGPLSDDAEVVQAGKELDCKPCGLHGWNKCPREHFDCAMTIDKNQLLKRIK